MKVHLRIGREQMLLRPRRTEPVSMTRTACGLCTGKDEKSRRTTVLARVTCRLCLRWMAKRGKAR